MARNWGRCLGYVLLAVLLTGCWDRTEVEDQGYIITLGLDRGEGDQILVTARSAIIQAMPSGTLESYAQMSEPRLAAALLTAQGRTITEAIHVLNGGMTRRLDTRQLRGVVVGESLAREGLEPLVMELFRSPLARGSVLFIQARGRAFDLLKTNDPVGEVNPAKMSEGFVLQAKQLHLAPPVRMHHFVSRLAASGGDPFLPVLAVNADVLNGAQEPQRAAGASALPGELPRGGGNPVEFTGTAIFRRDRLRGFLNVDETQMLLALRGEMGKAYLSLPDPDVPDQSVTIRFQQENMPKYQASFQRGRPHVHVKIVFEGEVLAIPGGTDYVPPVARERLERAAARFAEQTIRNLLNKLNEWETDPVGFGHLFRGYFPSLRTWEQYDWSDHVKELQVTVEADMRIRRYGLYTGPDRIPRMR